MSWMKNLWANTSGMPTSGSILQQKLHEFFFYLYLEMDKSNSQNTGATCQTIRRRYNIQEK
jgi:hypothetical protein